MPKPKLFLLAAAGVALAVALYFLWPILVLLGPPLAFFFGVVTLVDRLGGGASLLFAAAVNLGSSVGWLTLLYGATNYAIGGGILAAVGALAWCDEAMRTAR